MLSLIIFFSCKYKINNFQTHGSILCMLKISVSLSTKQNEWPINDDFCNYTASTWILATKKKSEGKDDENW